jgi:hypothetical protein
VACALSVSEARRALRAWPPARDAQIILGHYRLAVTLEIYSHEDKQAQHDTLGKISDALGRSDPAAP